MRVIKEHVYVVTPIVKDMHQRDSMERFVLSLYKDFIGFWLSDLVAECYFINSSYQIEISAHPFEIY